MMTGNPGHTALEKQDIVDNKRKGTTIRDLVTEKI
jgi:hypothetical protein